MAYFLKWSGVSWLDNDGNWVKEENEKKLYRHLTESVYKGDFEFPTWSSVWGFRKYLYDSKVSLQEMVGSFAKHLPDAV